MQNAIASIVQKWSLRYAYSTYVYQNWHIFLLQIYPGANFQIRPTHRTKVIGSAYRSLLMLPIRISLS